MKIVIIGGKGMLGRTLQKELDGHEIVIADLPGWDITDGTAFTARMLAEKPELVVHCAAMTDVDGCERDREKAFLLNETGTRGANRKGVIDTLSAQIILQNALDRLKH